jgi:DnaJ-class molecular chaperone
MGMKKIDCPTCWGGGNVGEDADGEEIPCPTCKGAGTITVSGDE